MKVDHSLIARVQLRCTGADVHQVSNHLSIYMLLSELPETPERLARFACVERELTAFCISGRIVKSSFTSCGH